MIAHAKHVIRQPLERSLNYFLVRLQRPRWLLGPGPLAGRDVCLMATYSVDGSVADHTLALCRAWHEHGFTVVLVVATPARANVPSAALWPDFLAGVLLRPNIGYDFGSWAAGLQSLPDVRHAQLLALTNDSIYGPLSGFDRMLARVRASPAAIVGLTDSVEICHHLQSYLVFYRPRAMQSDAFNRFWERVPLGGRAEVIVDRELKLLATMRSAGLDVEILFPADRATTDNPTLCGWRALLARGFPFVKVQLLRENPKHADLRGWQETLRQYAYDPVRVERHLGPRYASSAAAQAAARRASPDHDASSRAP